MDCAGKGSRSRCTGPATRRCNRCQAVSYCSISHRTSHWSVHKKECERLKQQMQLAHVLNDFPFTFSQESTIQIIEKRETRCSFLIKQGVHGTGMWKYECSCGESAATTSLDCSRSIEGWNLSSSLSPCKGPSSPIPKKITSWKDYYEWRCIPLCSPVALLLHWPLTLYWAIQLATSRKLIHEVKEKLFIHYLGPEKELHQLAVFAELHALFPGVNVHIDFVGPAIPKERDGEKIVLSSYVQCMEADCECKVSDECISKRMMADRSSKVTLQLHAGYYHNLSRDLFKDYSPHLIIAPNAGLAAYMSWLPTIELITESKIPAVFSDYCEEAAHLASSCMSTIASCQPTIPIQLNPFRQPLVVEDSALFLPCYSNCFVFGM